MKRYPLFLLLFFAAPLSAGGGGGFLGGGGGGVSADSENTWTGLQTFSSATITNLGSVITTIAIGTSTVPAGASGVMYRAGATASYMLFQNANTGPTLGDGLRVGVNASGQAIIYSHDQTNLQMGTYNNDTMLIIRPDGLTYPFPRTTAQINAITPGAKGGLVYNSTIDDFCQSTGTAAGAFKIVGSNPAAECR
jgi:hypothetical protein